MSLERDPVIDGVLREARAAASPDAADLAQALSGIRQRILAAPVLVHDAPDSADPDDAMAVRGSGPRPSGHMASSKWAAPLRRLIGTAVTLGVGFAIGVQYARHSPSPAPVLALPSASPLASATAQPPRSPLAQPLVAEAPSAARAELQLVTEPAAAEPVVTSTGRRAKSQPRVAARRSATPPARAAEVLVAERLAAEAGERLSFAQVLERLEQAQRAERDLEPEAALRLLDELDANSDARTLREERLVTRVLAACDVGDAAAAERAARELGNAGQASVYTRRIARSCAAPAIAASPPATDPR